MSQGAGLIANIFYQGIVEDRADPEKLGRVRVRVLGVHSESKVDVPTSELPWAPVVMAANNPMTSGVGTSPNGLVPGSWVLVFFADGGSLQNPVVIGSLAGVNASTKAVDSSSARDKANAKASVASASDAAVALANSDDYILGSTVKKYESGKSSVSTISSGAGDNGGKSYGSYQLASKTGTLAEYIKTSAYKSKFAGVAIASSEFDAIWKSLAKDDPSGFEEDQHNFIQNKLYVPAYNKLQVLDFQNRSIAVAEMVWSYAVQYGPGGAATKIKRALNGINIGDMSDADVITICYTDRYNQVPYDFKKSPALHNGLRNRFTSEKQDVLALCGQAPSKTLPAAKPLDNDGYGAPIEDSSIVYNQSSKGTVVGEAAFVDPTGTYPKAGYLGKVDTNRLARNEEINKTIQKTKKMSIVRGNGFNEPHTFAPEYPFNKVYESESGHVIEIDDTRGSERIHIYHRSGSFIEFHPDGTIVKKSLNDDNEVVMSNKSVYVFGNSSVFIEGDAKIQSMGKMTIETEADLAIRAGGNIEFACSGNMNLMAGAVMSQSAGSAIEQFATAIKQNNSSKSTNVTVNIGDKIELQKEAAATEEPEIMDDYGTDSDGATQVVDTKNDLDTNVGFVTATGDALTSSKEIDDSKETVSQPDVSVAENTETFKGSFKLSKNFTLADLTTNTAAFQYKLQAQCGLTEQEIVTNLMYLAENILEPVAARFNRSSFVITNSFRHVKGTSKSQHLLGMAVDLQFTGDTNNVVHIAQEIRKMLPAYDQCILEYHGNKPVIHISYNNAKNRNITFTTYSTQFKGLKPYGLYDANQNMIYSA